MSAPVRAKRQGGQRGARTRLAVNHGLREIHVGSAARLAEPTIVERDEVERRQPGPFRGRVYLVWTEHLPGGGCDRDPVADPHEDLGYVGKTIRDLAVRWLEHLAPGRIKNGERVKNNSAVFRHRVKVTGFSADPRVYESPEALAAAETRAIKTLWPAWNIQEQDRRNPHTRATRRFRKPDRLAPLIGIASVLWSIMWMLFTAGLLATAWWAQAAWYWIIACPFVALYIVNGSAVRHAGRMARRGSRR